MRQNKFGETYCHTAHEVLSIIERDAKDHVYVSNLSPPEGDFKATAEVVENVTGDTVCYIEAPTTDAVCAIAVDAKLDMSQL